jgi:hypothetical protein
MRVFSCHCKLSCSGEMVLEFNLLKTSNQFTGSPTKKNPAGNLQGPSIPKKADFFWAEGKGRGETGGRTYGET